MAVNNESGQSVIEFLLMLPVLIGLTILLVRINSAIQVSIVNQQYGRAQALFLTYNHSVYPRLEYQKSFGEGRIHQMLMGVSNNTAPVSGEKYVPEAAVQWVTRSKRVQASDAAREEPQLRANVRIRNTVTLCTPTFFVAGANGTVPLLPLGNDLRPIGRSNWNESSRMTEICRSPVKYE